MATSTRFTDVNVGTYLNASSSNNAETAVLYSGNRGTNAGSEQNLQFGDMLSGKLNNHLLIGHQASTFY